MKEMLDAEERDILKRFESGELRPVPDMEREIEDARQKARNTLSRSKRLQLRVSERDFQLAHSKAREEGVSCQALLSNVVHRYLSGRLVDSEQSTQSNHGDSSHAE